MIPASRSGGLARLTLCFVQSLPRLFVSLAAVCTVLAGCASATHVATADKPGTLVVSASATGGRLAWARARQRALREATEYCETRGMQTSLAVERTDGLEALQQHESVIQFECYPKI